MVEKFAAMSQPCTCSQEQGGLECYTHCLVYPFTNPAVNPDNLPPNSPAVPVGMTVSVAIMQHCSILPE